MGARSRSSLFPGRLAHRAKAGVLREAGRPLCESRRSRIVAGMCGTSFPLNEQLRQRVKDALHRAFPPRMTNEALLYYS